MSVHSPKFPNNIFDIESQMNGIAVIRPSFSEPFWLLV